MVAFLLFAGVGEVEAHYLRVEPGRAGLLCSHHHEVEGGCKVAAEKARIAREVEDGHQLGA